LSEFEGRTVLVTGASSGLGRACALRLAQEGASLALVGRQADALQEVAAQTGGSVHVCDLSDESAMKAMVARLKAEIGEIHGWVLAAGMYELRPLMMETSASLQSCWAVNVQGALGLLAAALKARLVARGGSIVLFSSARTRAGGPGLVSYAATKGALEAATRSLAMELAGKQIRVNAVSPGVIRTRLTEKLLTKMTPEQVAHLEAEHPLGFGLPEDVAGPVRFLLSNDARWITGSVLAIDGGLTIH
jgi:NAD(P)-dependent dehydrogenase (short-subunit alcohol dehydrogenase family)